MTEPDRSPGSARKHFNGYQALEVFQKYFRSLTNSHSGTLLSKENIQDFSFPLINAEPQLRLSSLTMLRV